MNAAVARANDLLEADQVTSAFEIMADEIARLTAALQVAREEVCWWVSEHGCCAGREDDAMTVIDAALGPNGDRDHASNAP